MEGKQPCTSQPRPTSTPDMSILPTRDTRPTKKLSGSRLADGTSDSKDRPAMTGWARQNDGIAPELTDVSETMLWALHNRASEARRRDGVLADPDSVRIHDAIDYDFKGRFGDPMGSLAARAAEIDRAVLSWLEHHPTAASCPSARAWKRNAVASTMAGCAGYPWTAGCDPIAGAFSGADSPFLPRRRKRADPAWMDAVDPQSDVSSSPRDC